MARWESASPRLKTGWDRTPKWIYDAGAKSYEVDGYLEPDYDDPIFLEKVENFVRVLAARYDNNPNVAYLFVGHYECGAKAYRIDHTQTWQIVGSGDTEKDDRPLPQALQAHHALHIG